MICDFFTFKLSSSQVKKNRRVETYNARVLNICKQAEFYEITSETFMLTIRAMFSPGSDDWKFVSSEDLRSAKTLGLRRKIIRRRTSLILYKLSTFKCKDSNINVLVLVRISSF